MPKHKAHARPEGATLGEVAKELGVTAERARQIELSALRKCREWCQRRGLRFEDIIR